MRRNRDEEVVPGGGFAVEDELPSLGVDGRELVRRVKGDASALEHPADRRPQLRPRDRHRLRLRGEQVQVDLTPQPSPPEVVAQEHRPLVRRARALVGQSAHDDGHGPAGEAGRARHRAARLRRACRTSARLRRAPGSLPARARHRARRRGGRRGPLVRRSRHVGSSSRSTAPRPGRSRRRRGTRVRRSRVICAGRRSPVISQRKDGANAWRPDLSTRTMRCASGSRRASSFAATSPPTPPPRITTVCALICPSEDQDLVRFERPGGELVHRAATGRRRRARSRRCPARRCTSRRCPRPRHA